MRDYQQRCFFIDGGGSNRLPALFASLVVDAILDECEVWIIEHLRSHSEVDAVLLDVEEFLFRIPFESPSLYILYNALRGGLIHVKNTDTDLSST